MAYRVPAAVKNSENFKRFIRIRRNFLILWLLIILICLISSSSKRSDLLDHFMLGFMLGAFTCIPCIVIAGIRLLPSLLFPRRRTSKKYLSLFDEDMYAHHDENSQWYDRKDWYNDVTNPASSLYQITHDIHRDH